jgi:hypothetical protein
MHEAYTTTVVITSGNSVRIITPNLSGFMRGVNDEMKTT